MANLKGRDHLGELDVDERKILRRILKKYEMRLWNGFSSLRIRTSGGFL
jgi:hypothetical protein